MKRIIAGVGACLCVLFFASPASAQAIVAPCVTIHTPQGDSCDRVTAANPLPITGGSGANASVGTNGAAVPTSSTQIGIKDGSGNLQPASATNPVPVTAALNAYADGAIATLGITTGTHNCAVPYTEHDCIGQLDDDIKGPMTAPYTATQIQGTITSAMTGTTSTQLLGAAPSSNRNYVTSLVCWNSHATVNTGVNIQDGSGGTIFWSIPAADLWGGSVVTFPIPLRQPTLATALYVVDDTTGAAVKCSAVGFTAP